MPKFQGSDFWVEIVMVDLFVDKAGIVIGLTGIKACPQGTFLVSGFYGADHPKWS